MLHETDLSFLDGKGTLMRQFIIARNFKNILTNTAPPVKCCVGIKV